MAQGASTSGKPTPDAATRLKEIRARVADIQRRLKDKADPAVVRELQAEIGRLNEVLAEVTKTAATDATSTADAPVTWPRDLSAAAADATTWGADPAEVVGG